jgi:hypothetical protein
VDVVFLDANVLFSAAYRPAAFLNGTGLNRLWRLEHVRFVSSGYAIEEARRNLDDDDQLMCLKVLRAEHLNEVEDVTEGPLPEGIALPEKDRPIFLSAIRAGATHLLTGDRAHFGPYFGQTIQGVLILPPADYLRARETPKAPENS